MAVTPEMKVHENRLRLRAERQGYSLMKSRRRDPRALDYGTWGIYNPVTGSLVYGSKRTGYGKTLEQIEAWLDGAR